jgi:enoyl-CoA hydratase/carnithine racemase
MFALAFDYRVMRSDYGYLCMNEVDMPAPFTPGMHSILAAKIPSHILPKVILGGHRFAGNEALSCMMVDAVADGDNEVLNAAMKLAEKVAVKANHAKGNGCKVFGWLKEGMYRETINALYSGKLGHSAAFLGCKEVVGRGDYFAKL